MNTLPGVGSFGPYCGADIKELYISWEFYSHKSLILFYGLLKGELNINERNINNVDYRVCSLDAEHIDTKSSVVYQTLCMYWFNIDSTSVSLHLKPVLCAYLALKMVNRNCLRIHVLYTWTYTLTAAKNRPLPRI